MSRVVLHLHGSAAAEGGIISPLESAFPSRRVAHMEDQREYRPVRRLRKLRKSRLTQEALDRRDEYRDVLEPESARPGQRTMEVEAELDTDYKRAEDDR